jgi:putative phosphoribosyl transferase
MILGKSKKIGVRLIMAKSKANNLPQEKLVVLSQSSEMFRDRVHAGRLLTDVLQELRGQKTVILGIPRGGMVIAREMARGLDADLDLVLSRKLRTPGQQELAMGSLSEDGNIFLNDLVVRELGITSRYIEQEKEFQMTEIKRRRQLFRKVLPKTQLNGRVVVVTDDGIATGATMQAALWAVRQEKPCTLVVAVPVATAEALEKVSQSADKAICLRQPSNFLAVGQFYERFAQVEDGNVLKIMEEEALRRNNMIASKK